MKIVFGVIIENIINVNRRCWLPLPVVIILQGEIMKKYLSVFLPLLFLGCASIIPIPTDYNGPDAGKMVIGIGAASGTEYYSYSFLFRKVGVEPKDPEKPEVGRLDYFQTNIFSRQEPDYQEESEEGVVLVCSLTPGDYEIYNFDVFYNGGTYQVNYSSKHPFTIPFSVSTGGVVYLGNYQANSIGRNLFGMSAGGAVFVVNSRLERDLKIAQKKDPTIPSKVIDLTPDVRDIANPYFIEIH